MNKSVKKIRVKYPVPTREELRAAISLRQESERRPFEQAVRGYISDRDEDIKKQREKIKKAEEIIRRAKLRQEVAFDLLYGDKREKGE